MAVFVAEDEVDVVPCGASDSALGGLALRDLETAILRQDASLSLYTPVGPVARPTTSPSVPAQLPPTIAGFVGRDVELASLDAILPQPPANGTAPARAVIISAIAGTAGVGKTALALLMNLKDYSDGQIQCRVRRHIRRHGRVDHQAPFGLVPLLVSSTVARKQ
jgi:hypothetical protein